MFQRKSLLALLIPLIFLEFVHAQETVPVTERDALIAIYNSTAGENWTDDTNWLTEEPVSTWYGVTTENGHVVSLMLPANNLRGLLPSELEDLEFLKYLKLEQNSLSGEFPNAVLQLSMLEKLYLYDNRFYGHIPVGLTGLQNLEILKIHETGLCNPNDSGLQNFLDQLTFYEPIPLCENLLTDPRDSIALVLLYDRLQGGGWQDKSGWLQDPVDDWFGIEKAGTRVTSVLLPANGLTGTMPKSIGLLSDLIRLELNGNSIGGTIPMEIGALSNLMVLDLSENSLIGEIPLAFELLQNLVTLSLSGNLIEGEMPKLIGELVNLQAIYLSDNQLDGTLPKELGQLSVLKMLDLSHNQFEGEIPKEFGQLNQLEELKLQNNQLSGSIQPELAGLVSLAFLDLSTNSISGSLPAAIGNLTALESINLSSNELSGELPPGISNLSLLTSFDISDNDLTGSIPIEIIDLDLLALLDFSGTMMCEPVEAAFVAWKQGRIFTGSGIFCAPAPDILSFQIDSQVGASIIQSDKDSVLIDVACPDDFIFEPVFTLSTGATATVDGNVQVSGVSSQDFSAPVRYILTTGTGSQAQWVVVVRKLNSISGVEVSKVPQFSCAVPEGSITLDAIILDNGSQAISGTAYSFQWFEGANSAIIGTGSSLGNLEGGDYRVLITENATGCQIEQVLEVADSTGSIQVSASVTPQTNCSVSNGAISINEIVLQDVVYVPPFNGFSFSWSSGSSSSGNLTGVPSGSYEVTITNQRLGCSYVRSYQVPDNVSVGSIDLMEQRNLTSCGTPNGYLAVKVDGTTEGYEFRWYQGNSASGGVISDKDTVGGLSNATYTVWASPVGSDCFVTRSFSIQGQQQAVDVQPLALANSSCTSSSGAVYIESVKIGSESTSALEEFDVTWGRTSALTNPISSGSRVENLSAGQYFVRVTSKSTGCASPVRSVRIEDNFIMPVFDLQTAPNMICQGTANGTASVSNLTGGQSVAWYVGDTASVISGESGTTLGNLSEGKYSVVVSNAESGCSTTKFFSIGNDFETLQVNAIGSDNTFCEGTNGSVAISSILVSGVATTDYSGFDLEWSTTADFVSILSTNPVVQGLEEGTYYVRATNVATGCASPVKSLSIGTDVQALSITLLDATLDVAGDEATGSLRIGVAGSNNFSTAWFAGTSTSGEVLSESTTFANVQAGSYTVLVKDNQTACSVSQSFTVDSESRLPQTISFELPNSIYQDELPLTLIGESDRNLPVSFEIVSGSGVIENGQLIQASPGLLTIRAFNEGSNEFEPASAAAQVGINATYEISGTIASLFNGASFEANVVLLNAAGEVLRETSAVDRSFSINNLRPGDYYLLFEVMGDANALAFDTYYPGTVFWDDAVAISLDQDVQLLINLEEKSAAAAMGLGTITGTLVESDGGSRIVNGRTLEGTPIVGAGVYLIDVNSGYIVSQAETDDEGVFVLTGVPSGRFVLRVDALGFEVDNLSSELIFDENGGPLDVSATINSDGLVLDYTPNQVTSVEEVLRSISIYPNPTAAWLRVESLEYQIEHISIINLLGQTAREFAAHFDGNYDVSGLPSGIYLLQLQLTSNKVVQTKIRIR